MVWTGELEIMRPNKDKTIEEYSLQLSKLKEICSNLSKAPHHRDLSEKYGLRDSRWFIYHCQNNLVYDYNSFMEHEVGILPNYSPTKEKIRDMILKKSSELGRKIGRKDFENHILPFSMGTVVRTFGSLKKMNMELGFNYIHGGVDTKKDINEIINIVQEFLSYLETKSEFSFTIEQFNSFCRENNKEISYQTCNKRMREEIGLTFREYVNRKSFSLCNAGTGYNFLFADGEKVYSIYEKYFSEYLRKNKIKYEKDIKYKDIFKNINENYTLDYVLYLKNRLFFIEIAGILRDYQRHYEERIKILSSNSKEKYRISLLKKEKILKDNNVDYLILFPNKSKDFNKIIIENLHFLIEKNADEAFI